MVDLHSVLIVAVTALVTMLLRFLPFIAFNSKRKTPEAILYLGRVLPYATMGMLVVYCLRNISLATSPFGLPELLAGALVVLLHIAFRNSLVSIVGGTVCYVLLIRICFV